MTWKPESSRNKRSSSLVCKRKGLLPGLFNLNSQFPCEKPARLGLVFFICRVFLPTPEQSGHSIFAQTGTYPLCYVTINPIIGHDKQRHLPAITMKVLLVEDEADTRHLLNTYFSAQHHEVVETDNGLDAVRLFYESRPDLILLDVRMPKLDGWQVLEQIRKNSNIPILMITALDSGEDAVKGLKLGADDYLRKPFDLSELEARIRNVIRRAETPGRADLLQAGGVSMDDRSKEVMVDGRQVSLSPREYDLLKLLISDPDRVHSPEEIIQSVWPNKSNADATDVKQYIHLLRNKIETSQSDHRLIQTVKGFGYRFCR